MKRERIYIKNGLAFGIGFSTDLWHIKRGRGKIVSFFHIGYMPDFNPKLRLHAKLLVLTLLWFTVRIGTIKPR